MKTVKLKIIEKLRDRFSERVSVKVPLSILNNIKIFVEKCNLYGYSLDNFYTFLFINGYLVYRKFILGDVKSLLNINLYSKFISENFTELISINSENEYIIGNEILIFLENELSKMKISFSEFNEYVKHKIRNENGINVVMTKNRISEYLEEYKSILRNGRIKNAIDC